MWTVLHIVRNDELEDVHVSLYQIKSALSLLLMAGCGNGQLGVGSHAIAFARETFWCSKEKAAVLEIHHLPLELASMTSARASSAAMSFI